MFIPSYIKQLSFFLLMSVSLIAKAQQVKKIDCCKDISSKATIIINDNSSAASSSSSNASATPSYGKFNFELSSSLNTSAGVYDASGNLVRTLWGGVKYDAGCYEGQWDGLLDDGSQAPNGSYNVKILTNNVQYTWEGGIGDSSTEPLNNDTRLGGNDYTTMVTIGQKVYIANGYSEHSTSQQVLNLADINKRVPYYGNQITTLNNIFSCTDDNIIYYGGDKSGDPTNNYQSWVVGIYPADSPDPSKFIQFPARVTASYRGGSGNFDDQNAIAYSNNANGYLTGIAVQKTGNFLFVSRGGLNQLQVIDKRVTSGAVLQTLSITGIGDVAADANTYLYALVSGQLRKYTVAADATITNTNTSFTGTSNGSKVAYSIALGKIAVFDNTTLQIKIYNSSGGAPVQVIGATGGYTTSPFFDAARLVDANFLYYQQDGTLWIGQPALHSILHYNLDFTLKEESQHLPTSRCTTADQNNPSSLFSNYSEFTRDYSKTLDNGTNGSWKFAANWSNGVNTSNNNYDGLTWVCTLSNGHRYAIEYRAGANSRLVELTNTGLRVILDYIGDQVNIGRDGTWYEYSDNGSNGNQPTGIYRRMLTGFDSNNNPVWGSSTLWIANPTDHSVYTPWYGYQNKTSGLTAAADKYIYFFNGIGGNDPTGGATAGYRLGAIKSSNGKPVWKTARTTFSNYNGPYPSNGDFDIGNNTGYFPQHSETHAMVYDNDVFWNVNGEFWQNTEANYWNHFDAKTGLVIGHFGTDGNLAKFVTGAPEMAGNAFSVQVVKVNGNYYIYHCDESVHPFVHSWKVSGLNTINVTTVPITVTAAITLPADASNLMTGIPYQSTGFYGGNGWTMNPSSGENASVQYPGWRVTTTRNAYRKDDNDVYIESDGNANGSYKTVTRALGSNNTNNWTFTGSFKVTGNLNSNYSLNIIDASGKVVMQLRTQYNRFYLNGAYYYELQQDANVGSFKFIPFTVKNVNGQVSVTINNYLPQVISSFENGGNFVTPTAFQIRAGGAGDQKHTLMSVKGLRFVMN